MKIICLGLISFLFIINSIVSGQSYYKKYYTNTVIGHWDKEFIETSDSSYLIISNEQTGSIANGGFIYKISKNGQFLWHKSYHYFNKFPEFYSICLIDSGNFIVTAILDSLNTYGYLKLDSVGNILSINQFNKMRAPKHTKSKNNVLMEGNNLVFFGNDSTATFPVVTKTDLNGNVLWSKKLTVGVMCNENIVSMDVDLNGNIYINCEDRSGICSTSDTITKLIKLDASGNVTWAKQYSFAYDSRKVKCINNNRIIVVGEIPGIVPWIFAFEIDSSGIITYSKNYQLSIGTQSIELSFEADTLKNIFVINGFGQIGYFGQYIMVTKGNGFSISLNAYDDTVYNSYSSYIGKTSDNGWLLVGTDVIKFDSSFNSNCPLTSSLISENSNLVNIYPLTVISDTIIEQITLGNYPIIINNNPLIENSACLPMKIKETEVNQLTIFPNPASERITIRIEDHSFKNIKYEIYDVTGRIIRREFEYLNDYSLVINISTMVSGFYFLKVHINEREYTIRFIKE